MAQNPSVRLRVETLIPDPKLPCLNCHGQVTLPNCELDQGGPGEGILLKTTIEAIDAPNDPRVVQIIEATFCSGHCRRSYPDTLRDYLQALGINVCP